MIGTKDLPRLQSIIESMKGARVAVIGDLVADHYLYGLPERLSREAPVLVIRYEGEEVVPGGAANAAFNLVSLGAQVDLLGAVGDDDFGSQLLTAFSAEGASTEGIVVFSDKPTVTKTRVLAGETLRTKQQLLRIDREPERFYGGDAEETLLEHLDRIREDVQAFVFSDYGYFTVTPRVISRVLEIAAGRPVVADSRYRLAEFSGVTAVTPNVSEAEVFAGAQIVDRDGVRAAGKRMLAQLRSDSVLITRGNQGMALLTRSGEEFFVPVMGGEDVVDVTGAGDTVVAVLTAALVGGGSLQEATILANSAAGVVVMKTRAATLTPSELLEALSRTASRLDG